MHLLDRSCVIVGIFLKYCVPQQVVIHIFIVLKPKDISLTMIVQLICGTAIEVILV